MDKTKLLTALTTLHERELDYPQWGLTGILMREFTARERQFAQDAVQSEANDGDVDQTLYRAMLMQRCLTDPTTGRPYADGRTDPTTGQPAIDPRTRTPIFTVEEVNDIADSRAILFNMLWDNLIELAALGPQAMFSSDRADVSAERDQGTGVEGAGEGPGGDEDSRPGHADGGSAILGDDRTNDGAATEPTA